MANNFPNLRPSLNLDFGNMRCADPRLSHVRSTTDTYYDGKTFELYEENRLRYSNVFTNSNWVKAASGLASAPVVTEDYGVAPNGTMSADRVQFSVAGNTSSDFSAIYQIGPSSGSETGSGSIWIKSNTVPVTLRLNATSSGSTVLNVTTEWQRFSRSVVGADRVYLFLRGDDGAAEADVCVYEGQLENRSLPTVNVTTQANRAWLLQPALVTAQINEPVFEYDPVTNKFLGLRIQKSGSNLVRWSEDFSKSEWNPQNCTVNVYSYCNEVVSTVANGAVGFVSSHYGNSDTARVNFIEIKNIDMGGDLYLSGRIVEQGMASYWAARINLSTGTVVTQPQQGTIVIRPLPNGWLRIYHRFTPPGSTYRSLMFYMSSTAVGQRYLVRRAAQLSTPHISSYIKTEGATASRGADYPVIPSDSWYTKGRGTLLVDVTIDAYESFNRIFKFDGYVNVNSVSFQISGRGNGPSYSVGVDYRYAIASDESGTSVVRNGSAAVTSTANELFFAYNSNPVLALGHETSEPNVRQLNGYIRSVRYFPKRLSDTELIALTR